MKQILILFIILTIATVSVIAEESIENSDSSVGEETFSVRRRKHRFPNGLWYAGLRTLSVLVAIKVKIILVLAFFGGLAWLSFRYFSGHGLGFGCGSVYKESPIIPFEHSISPYHLDHSDHEIISSYPGPEPWSSGYSSYSSGAEAPTASASGPYKRVSKGSRAIESDWSDLAFTFLGVRTGPCKKRFICEFDFKAKSNPIMGFAYSYINGNYLQKYRSTDDEVPQTLKDCGRIYYQCRMPGEKPYVQPDHEGGEVFDDEKNEINTTLVTSDEGENNIDDKENTTTESTTLEPIGRLILKRSMKSN